MALTVQLDDSALGTVLRSLIREAEGREREAANLGLLLQDTIDQNTKMREIIENGTGMDLIHDRLEQLTAENNHLSNELVRLEANRKIEVDYFTDRVQDLRIQNDALIDWNEEAHERITDLMDELEETEKQLDYVVSLRSESDTPYSVPNDAIIQEFHDGEYDADFNEFNEDDDSFDAARQLKAMTS